MIFLWIKKKRQALRVTKDSPAWRPCQKETQQLCQIMDRYLKKFVDDETISKLNAKKQVECQKSFPHICWDFIKIWSN